jgi:hypothetical protein
VLIEMKHENTMIRVRVMFLFLALSVLFLSIFVI